MKHIPAQSSIDALLSLVLEFQMCGRGSARSISVISLHVVFLEKCVGGYIDTFSVVI